MSAPVIFIGLAAFTIVFLLAAVIIESRRIAAYEDRQFHNYMATLRCRYAREKREEEREMECIRRQAEWRTPQ